LRDSVRLRLVRHLVRVTAVGVGSAVRRVEGIPGCGEGMGSGTVQDR
jgi:hypothetical protein